MLLFAMQLLGLGIGISAILNSAPNVGRFGAALGNFGALARNQDKVRKGLQMQGAIRSAKVPVHRNVSSLVAVGSDRLTSVIFEADGRESEAEVDTLLVHEGILPNTQLSRAIGCRHVWDEIQHCLRPEIDRFGESSVPGVFIVGDGAAINGAVAASASAEIAVGRILERRGRADARSRATVRSARGTMARERVFRPFLDALYPPRISAAPISDATLVCRCEEVSAGAIRSAIKDGATGPAQVKAFTRCGMGPCQGRLCGPVVSRLIANETNRTNGDVGAYNVRFPLKPVTVSEIANCRDADSCEEEHHAA